MDVGRCTLVILFVDRLMDDCYLNHAAKPRKDDDAVLVSWGMCLKAIKLCFSLGLKINCKSKSLTFNNKKQKETMST